MATQYSHVHAHKLYLHVLWQRSVRVTRMGPCTLYTWRQAYSHVVSIVFPTMNILWIGCAGNILTSTYHRNL